MRGVVFLDLDGTLADPKPGITGSVQYALRQAGLPVPDQDDLEWVIGPPLLESFAKLNVPDPDQALSDYRVNYSGGAMFDAAMYPGIPEALATLSDAGYRLCVATAKPHVYAEKITARLGIDQWFYRQFGPELDGTHNDKADLLRFALGEMDLTSDRCVMVGDRSFDLLAAKANDMTSIAVTWGYGKGEALDQANIMIDRADELPQAVFDLLPG